MKIYAHRGASGTHPENTLAAFHAALALGADGIELDVQATADRVPVVLHDRSLERTTNGRGNIDELTLAELKQHDAGSGERVPTLEEVLALVGDRAHLDVEIKGQAIEAEVLVTLGRYSTVRWAISSFDWTTLRTLRHLDAGAELWPLATAVDDALFSTVQELGSPAVSLAADAYTPASATKLREAGVDVVIWTVNDEREARRVRDLGAVALCTDVPGTMLRALRGQASLTCCGP
jgi:glycerophosphoryl diester phosphodiesterase